VYVFEDINEERPRTVSKSLAMSTFNKHHGDSMGMKGIGSEMNHPKIVVNVAPTDEHPLIGRHQPRKLQRQFGCQDLGYELPKAMNKADRAIGGDVKSVLFLRQQEKPHVSELMEARVF
jgi:hypothetical protein